MPEAATERHNTNCHAEVCGCKNTVCTPLVIVHLSHIEMIEAGCFIDQAMVWCLIGQTKFGIPLGQAQVRCLIGQALLLLNINPLSAWV